MVLLHDIRLVGTTQKPFFASGLKKSCRPIENPIERRLRKEFFYGAVFIAPTHPDVGRIPDLGLVLISGPNSALDSDSDSGLALNSHLDLKRCIEYGSPGFIRIIVKLHAQKLCAGSACRRCGKPERITGTSTNVAQLLPRDVHYEVSHTLIHAKSDTPKCGSKEH
ncbi:hypothetical protein EVAR_29897_1 [Eumeta japonica]|uniref:Uncharacterized protein n=1 Tax=Eumeta variegata TaxID=151549 RepID=A0A4C1V871_EUMVA|nr:hypothetical protein EVAR_29897_1 [Eumeta japonica]